MVIFVSIEIVDELEIGLQMTGERALDHGASCVVSRT